MTDLDDAVAPLGKERNARRKHGLMLMHGVRRPQRRQILGRVRENDREYDQPQHRLDFMQEECGQGSTPQSGVPFC